MCGVEDVLFPAEAMPCFSRIRLLELSRRYVVRYTAGLLVLS